VSRARTLTERIAEIRPEHVAHTGGFERPRRRFWLALPVLAIAALLGLRAVLHDDPLERLDPVAASPDDPPGTTARAGSLAITRGGPVILGFQSEAPARLVLGGRELSPPSPHHELVAGMALADAHRHVPALARAKPRDDGRIALATSGTVRTLVTIDGDRIASVEVELHGKGLVKGRAVVLAGAAPIRFAAPPGARLMWSPVGRRGDLEYLPASSLSPEPPAAATFDAPGTARLDGAIALAILGVVLATLAWLARRRLAALSRDTWLAMAGVLAVALVARLVGLGDQGQTWDEDVNWAAGRNYVTNLLALDFSERSWMWNFEHPPVMKVLAGIGAQLADGFGPARVLSAVWSALGCTLLVPIGTRLFRFRVGVLAAAIAALLPPLVAHGQIVGHEAPTLLWWSLAILLALGVHDYLPTDDRRALRALVLRLAGVGVVIGIAIASRFVNGLVGPVCALIVVLAAPERWRRATIGWGALVMPLAALATVYAVWPRLWLHPIANLAAALAKLDTPHSPEPFLGALTTSPGPHYFALYLIATLPVGVLAGIVLWLARAAIDVAKRRAPLGQIVVFAWLAIPLVGIMLSPVRQDGVRYVMPCLLALALMAAVGLDAAAGWIGARLGGAVTRTTWVFVAGASVLVGYLGITVARSAPYHLDYFGEHAGSAGQIAEARTFETAWWGEGLDRAIAYVNTHAEPGARVYRGCIEAQPLGPVHLAWFREDLWRPMARSIAEATWIVTYAPATRACRLPPEARKVYEVTHDGLTLAAVWRRGP
jgi:4-amino-4-deoxy-L-arabinose transferase-like glycosyltransferase